MSNPFQQVINESASVDHSINDDDYYIVHPGKKHIVSKVYAKVPYGRDANEFLKSYISSADKRHGAGHKAMKGMHIKREAGYTRLSESTEYADAISRTVLGSYSTNVDEAKDTVVKDKDGNVVSFKHTGDWKKSKGDGTTVDKSGAKHTPYSKVRDKARAAIKKVSESEVDQIDEISKELALKYLSKSGKAIDKDVVKQRRIDGYWAASDRLSGLKATSDKKKKKEALEQYTIDEAAKGPLHRVLVSYDDPSGSGRASAVHKVHAPSKEHAKSYTSADLKHRKNLKIHRVSLVSEETIDEMSAEEFDALIEDFEQLDELSKETLTRYVKAANRDKNHIASWRREEGNGGGREAEAERKEAGGKRGVHWSARQYLNRKDGLKAAKKRGVTVKSSAGSFKDDGMGRARGYNSRPTESVEEFDAPVETIDRLDELSKATLGSYIKKATGGLDGVAASAYQAGSSDNIHNSKKLYAKARKRVRGVAKATDRLTKEDLDRDETEAKEELVDESMVLSREKNGRKFVSAEAAIILARKLAAKRKEGEKPTHNDLIAARKKLVGEETIDEAPKELDESFEVVDDEGKVVHVAYSESEAKKHADQKQSSTGKKHTVRFKREASVPTK